MNNNQPEFDSFACAGGDRLLLGLTEPFATSLPWEKDTLSLDVTKLAPPLAPLLTNEVTGTLAENFLASGSYPYSPLIGESLLAGPQFSSFGVLEPHDLAVASGSEVVGKTLDQLLLEDLKAAAIAEWVSLGLRKPIEHC